MTIGDLMEAVKAVAAIGAMLGGLGGLGLWAMRAIIRAELRATAETLIRVEAAVGDHERRIGQTEHRLDAMSRAA